MKFRPNLIGVSLIALLSISICVLVQPAFCQDEPQSLEIANSSVNIAFEAVLSAEKAGADVTGLLAQLNVAADLLTNAENSYRSGDMNSIESNTDQAVVIARQVTAQAATLEQSATEANQNAILTSVVFTIIGSVIFVLVLLLVWQEFEKRYYEKIMRSKPEVVEN